MNDDLRAKFEAWAKANGYRTDHAEAGQITLADYKASSTAHHAFEGFQAAASLYAKDAERYRWLRDKSNAAPDQTPTVYSARVVFGSGGSRVIYGSDLDAAVDAALEGEPK